jgi:hypothetical protein
MHIVRKLAQIMNLGCGFFFWILSLTCGEVYSFINNLLFFSNKDIIRVSLFCHEKIKIFVDRWGKPHPIYCLLNSGESTFLVQGGADNLGTEDVTAIGIE